MTIRKSYDSRRVFAILLFTATWLALTLGSITFSKKPPVCMAIRGLPFVIEASGCYQLHDDLELKDLSGVGILIRTNRVRIDLGGHQISGPSNRENSTTGIRADGRRDVIVENGTISGFSYGVQVLPGPKGKVSELFTLRNVALLGNHQVGAAINGIATTATDNRVEHTGESLLHANAFATGIEITGADCVIRRNRVFESYASSNGESSGISLSYDIQGCKVENNEVRNSRRARAASSYGIRLTNTTYSPDFSSNAISGFSNPVARVCSTINQLPYTISNAGCYKLRAHLKVEESNGVGVLIASSNVSLNLDGYQISGPSDSRTSSIGIYAEGVQDVTVEGGAIAGFLYGVRLEKSVAGANNDRFVLRKMVFSNNYFRGVSIIGKNTIIENTNVERTGGSTFFPDAFAIGIEVNGENCRVRRNRILDIHGVGKGEAVGISMIGNVTGCVVENNKLETSPRLGESQTFGIRLAGLNQRIQMFNNRTSGFTHATN